MSSTDNTPPITADNVDCLWTADETAKYLKVSRSLVYAKAASGELPCLHVFSRLRFDPVTIKAWALKQDGRGATVTDLWSRKK